jgi:predicted AlkP superfamily pyrophosphatase or phosphodiesterase
MIKILFLKFKIYSMKQFLLCVFLFSILNVMAGPESDTRLKLPKVVIGIIVENMRSDYIDRFWNNFGNEGFKKLYSQGYNCSNFRMDQLVMNNATGTATLFTGVTPSIHGIINFSWYDRNSGLEKNCVADSHYPTVGNGTGTDGISPGQLQCSTFADQLKIYTNGKAKVYTMAMNKAPATFSCGFSGDAAFWFDETSGNMVTSSFYLSKLPEWAIAFNSQKWAQLYSSRNWALMKSISEYRESLPDNDSLEAGFGPGLNVFPYKMDELVKNAGNFSPMKATPYANSIIKSFFNALLDADQIGEDDIPDLITLFFSSMDDFQGSFGPASMETEDLYLRLDQEIAEVIHHAENKFGKENVVFYLTSNTPASYSANHLKERYRIPAGYFSPESAYALLNSFLNLTFGDLRWIESFDGNQLYFNHKLIELNKVDLNGIRQKAAHFLSQFEGIRLTFTADQIEQNQLPENLINTINKSYSYRRSGDVIYMLQQGWQPVSKNKRLNYTDQHLLPLVFYGAGIKPVNDKTAYQATDLVPTLSEIMGVSKPDLSCGKTIDIFKNQGK